MHPRKAHDNTCESIKDERKEVTVYKASGSTPENPLATTNPLAATSPFAATNSLAATHPFAATNPLTDTNPLIAKIHWLPQSNQESKKAICQTS